MTRSLSILDLAPTSAGSGRKDALDASLRLAQAGEQAGYHRYWMAEHHGSATFMSSATSLLLARAGEHTSTIRLGSGGVMLPNHAPLMVAEYYGTLATLYPDRIDLGLGRAPGTDPVTAAELRRGGSELNDFAQDVLKLKKFLAASEVDWMPDASGAEAAAFGLSRPSRSAVRAIPGEGTEVPIWMLGSSTGGARVAAELGLPFSFASHFAPQQISDAVAMYRAHFNSSADTAEVVRPVVMAGVNVMVAESTGEAAYQFTTSRHLKEQIRYGISNPLAKPTKDDVVMPGDNIDPTGIVGSPDVVAEKMAVFADAYEIDELIVTCYAHDPAVRIKSYELLAKEWGL